MAVVTTCCGTLFSPADVHLYGLTFDHQLAFEVSRKMITMHLPLLAFYRYGFGFSWMFAAQMVLAVSGIVSLVELTTMMM